MNRIKCSVEECTYQNNNECYADAIEVRSSGDMVVETSDGTACETFAPKGKK
ncbi:MAG: DUF1540 domain-containing protein [Zhaonellaceae bacterium]|jgi:hypothetical protein|nr:DUF1540 domain-containing protein [Clostridia bacterium]